MRKEYLEMLRECSLKDGVLTIPKVKNSKMIAEISNELRYDLFNYQIPHWKAIGIKVVINDTNLLHNYISKINGLNRSYAELFAICEDLIFTDCSRQAQEARIKMQYENVEQWSYAMATKSEITSSNNTIYYEGYDNQDIAETVIQNINIVTMQKKDMEIHFLLRYGVGSLSFIETNKLIAGTNYIPVAQLYDLNRVFSIKIPELKEKEIYFYYKRKVNELVLEKLLKQYAERN